MSDDLREAVAALLSQYIRRDFDPPFIADAILSLLRERGVLAEWRPSDEPPIFSKQVLAWDSADCEADKVLYSAGKWADLLGRPLDAETITAWMPLPSGPKDFPNG